MSLKDALNLEKRLRESTQAKQPPAKALSGLNAAIALEKERFPGRSISQEKQILEAQDPLNVFGEMAKGAYNLVTGADRETEETKTLPEFTMDVEAYATEPVKAMKTTLGMLTSATDEGRIKIIKENFPEFKVTKDKKGNDIIETPEGERAVLNKPGLSKNDIYKLAFETAWFLGPQKVAKIGEMGTAAKTAIVGGGEGGMELGKELVSKALGSEEEISPMNIGLTALTASGMELGSGIRKSIKSKAVESKLGALKSEFKEATEATKAAQEVTEGTAKFSRGGEGVQFGRAQKTGNLTDLERQAHLAAQEGASYKAMKFFSERNKEVEDAVLGYLDTFGTAQVAEEASEKIVKAAGDAVTLEKGQIQRMASPFYKKALKDKRFHSVADTKGLIKGKMNDLSKDSPRYAKLNKTLNYLTPSKEGKRVVRGLRMKQLDQAKKDIDGLIKSAQKEGQEAELRDLVQIKKSLLADMEKANPLYEKGRLIYEEGMPFQTKIEKTTLGKIANLKQDQLQKVRKLLFDVGEEKASPETVRFARQAIRSQNPEAWNAIVRAELENRMTRMSAEFGEESFRVENIPGQFHRTMFGTRGKRESIYAALDTEQKKNLRYLEHALQRSSSGRPGGSQTANRAVFNDELGKGGIVNRIIAITKPRETVKDAAVGAQRVHNAKALSNIMFDPKWAPDMKKIRKLSPDSAEGKKKFDNLFREVIKSAAISQAQKEDY